MTIQYLGDGNTDGVVVFQTGEKGAFFGATPAVQPASANQAAVTSPAAYTAPAVGATTVVSNAATDLKTLADAYAALITKVTAMTTLVNQLRSDLVAQGLIKGSA